MTYFLKYKNATVVTLQMMIRCIFVAKPYKLIENLTYDLKNVLTWFKINSMKANPEKFQFMILSKTRRPEYNLLIDSNVIKESADVEILRLIIDSKLCFENILQDYAKQHRTNFTHPSE